MSKNKQNKKRIVKSVTSKNKITSKRNTTNKKSSKSKKNISEERHSTKKQLSPKERLIIKKSLTTAKIKPPFVRIPFLVLVLLISTLIVGAILFIFLSPFIKKSKPLSPLTPHKLSTIPDSKSFLTIRNSLLENTIKPSVDANVCLKENFFHKSPQQITHAYDKFLIILKRGKIFVTNTSSNKFIGYTEISPYPVKENNAINYTNIFFNDGVLIVTGYRTETTSLEISTFPISTYGKVTRGNTYNLPSSICNFSTNIEDSRLTFYTSKNLSKETTLKNIQIFNQWSPKLNKFITTDEIPSKIFYDNASLLENPIIHTLTTCQLEKYSLSNCQQRHLIANNSSGHSLSNDAFYLWTTQVPKNNTSSRIIPASRLYKFDLGAPTIDMIQLEGRPLTQDSISINNTEITASIYQNNIHAPAWYISFTNGTTANLNIHTNDFTGEGNFINSPDNYTTLSNSFNKTKNASEEIISSNHKIITINRKKSTINSYSDSTESVLIDGTILSIKKLSDKETALIIYKKETSLIAKIIDLNTFSTSNSLVLQEDAPEELSTEISFFNLNNQSFASITTIDNSLNKGSIRLLNITNDKIILLNNTAFTKAYQRTTDHCQNDCQQSWKNQLQFFVLQTTNTPKNTIIYATIGSKLKKFILDDSGTIRLLKTIDYTYHPALPKRLSARIPGGAKIVNGKYVCGKKHGYVGKSKSNNKGYLHLDLECCLDPDEYPNPWCTYKPGELSVTKLRYKDYHGRVKIKKH